MSVSMIEKILLVCLTVLVFTLAGVVVHREFHPSHSTPVEECAHSCNTALYPTRMKAFDPATGRCECQ